MFVIYLERATGVVFFGDRGRDVSVWGAREGAATFGDFKSARAKALRLSVRAEVRPA